MTTTDEAATYWLSLFTRETWLESAKHGFSVMGFPQSRWTTIQRIKPGDWLICYLTGTSSYVGLLRVIGEPYRDDAVIWRSQIFPSRLPVEPILTLHPDHGVPIKSLGDRLSYFRSAASWGMYFRGAPTRIKPEDAKVIVEALLEAARDRSRVLDVGQPHAPNIPGRSDNAPQESSSGSVDEAVVGKPLAPTTAEVDLGAGPVLDEVEQLAGRLLSSAGNSESSRLLEEAVVYAFRFLGFQAEHRSGSGDTDSLVFAQLGKDAYKAIVDAKSSRHERVANAAIDWIALSKHREMYKATYILVVGPGFAGGDLLENARKMQVALVTARDLAEIIRMHALTPFSLEDLRELFSYPGDPNAPIRSLKARADELARLQRLLPDIIKVIGEFYGLEIYSPVTPDSLLYPLRTRGQGRVYTRDEIAQALQLLSMPQLGILRHLEGEGYVLQMTYPTAIRSLRALLRVLEAELPS